MTTQSSGSKEKQKQKDVIRWIYDHPANEYAKFTSADDEAFNHTEYARLKRERRKLAGCLLFSTLLSAALIFLFYAVKEKDKIRGITLAYRNKPFPVPLPYGTPQLHSIDTKYTDRANGLNLFSPFVAATQEKGKLFVMTNLTSPRFHAFTVQHPEIVDITMITLDFFCCPATCFYIDNVYNKTFFGESGLALLDLSSQLVKMPLPEGMRFLKAQSCHYLRGCRILLQNNKGKQHFAIISQDDIFSRPVIHPIQFPRLPADLINRPMEVMAFHNKTMYEHVVLWIDGELAVVFNDAANNWQEMSIITDAEVDEVVEIHEIADKVWAMLLMKEDKQLGKTRVRFYALCEGALVIRYDDLIVFNRPSAISVFVSNDTFEICELPQDSSHLKCYSSLLPHEPATK
ncbi:hypothetical protein PMAYCL1PPCAC_26875 [Pristionchus mayeri]|uniref:Uncharacterized protein n=1 Tax=Pristionchus mayeri TaxID=1317129 RepID=A0AAN5D6R7_9BILA|nr:hypothetical protein PMAYCL1PPCAC_26875 [Pristionchus mayeri]